MAVLHENRLDVVPGKTSPVTIHLNQDDEDYTLKFQLYATDATLSIESGTTATMRGKLGDGSSYTRSASLSTETINGASVPVVTVQGDKTLTGKSGTGKYEIGLTHSGKSLYTANFTIKVEPSPVSSG